MSIKKAVRDDIPWISLMGWFDKNVELKKIINFSKSGYEKKN